MKTKAEHIDFWLTQAEDDWKAVQTLFNGGNYLQSLFFAHLVREKLCKALWIKHHEANVPPRTHNVMHLLSTLPVEPDENRSVLLLNLNRFQMEGRYPDYLNQMLTICNESFTEKMLEETNNLRLWLLGKLQ